MDIVETIRVLKQEDSKLIDTTLQFIHYEMHGFLKEVGKVHLLSAEQAFISASTSNNAESETRVGIGHLRDSFHSFQLYLENGRTKFGFYKTAWEPETRTSIELKLASIALVISLVYKRLNDESNFWAWKKIGLAHAKDYINNRQSAVSDWQNAMETYTEGSYSIRRRPNYRIRELYDKELVFIDLFSKAVKEI
jgi:hypothetical protein